MSRARDTADDHSRYITENERDDGIDRRGFLIDNFSFTPAVLTVARNTQVRWVNHDDVPHTIMSAQQRFGVVRPRHRPGLLRRVHHGRDVRLLLLSAIEDDRQDHCAVSDKP